MGPLRPSTGRQPTDNQGLAPNGETGRLRSIDRELRKAERLLPGSPLALTQNGPFVFTAVASMAWSISQCSTTLPSRTRKMSTCLLPTAPGSRTT